MAVKPLTDAEKVLCRTLLDLHELILYIENQLLHYLFGIFRAINLPPNRSLR